MSGMDRDSKTLADFLEDMDYSDFAEVVSLIITDLPRAAYYAVLRNLNENYDFESYYLNEKLEGEVADAYEFLEDAE